MAHESEVLREHFGNWGDHSRHPPSDWQHEVTENNTRLGYWEWVASLLDQEVADFRALFETMTAEVADRLLGLGDEFLDDWAQDAVQNGKADPDYETRIQEWRQIRPLLAGAPTLLKALLAIIEAARTSDQPRAVYCAEIARNALAEIAAKSSPEI
jgi:hypothetical protein